MTSKNWTDLTHWGETKVEDDDGRIAICFGLSATLYFREGHSAAKRTASLACFNEFAGTFGGSLNWYFAGQGPFHRVSKLRNRDMTPYLLSPKWENDEAREHAWAFYWHGAEQPEDASPLKMEAYGSPRMYSELDDSLSFLQASVPLDWFADHPDRFVELVRHWCELLSPDHGYGGLTLLTSPDRGLTQFHAPTTAGFAARYPGIEIDRPMSHKLATQSGIKGGNWLTVLSECFDDELGGEEALRGKLGEPFHVEGFDGGVLIRAGSVPEVGDSNQNLDAPLYRHLASVLRPIRVREHPSLYPKGRFAEEGEFAAWLARFDD